MREELGGKNVRSYKVLKTITGARFINTRKDSAHLHGFERNLQWRLMLTYYGLIREEETDYFHRSVSDILG